MKNIYIIRSETFLKIGIAQDISRRLKGLQTGNPIDLELFYSEQTCEPTGVEEEIHRRLTKLGFHKRGEWFTCTPEFARRTVRCVIELFDRGDIMAESKGGDVVLSKKLVRKVLTKGIGLPKRKAEILGLSFPLKRGWMKKLVGTTLTRDQWNMLIV